MSDWFYHDQRKTCERCGFTTHQSDTESHDCLQSLSARLDAAECELASLRERHDKAISLLSDVVLQNTRMNERLMRVEGWMKAELRAK